MLFDTGCNNASLYGSECDDPCPMNCKDSTCHIQNGTCFNCKPGWNGTYCKTSELTNRIVSQVSFLVHFHIVQCQL